MKIPKTLLVPTDFGEAAAAALDYAIGLADALEAGVALLHVYELPVVGFPDATAGLAADVGRRIVRDARTGVERLIAERKNLRVPVRSYIEHGNAWRVILEVAERENATMIVMGTHGRRGLPRTLVGSVAEKIVRMSSVPVLIVHGRHEDAQRTVPMTRAM